MDKQAVYQLLTNRGLWYEADQFDSYEALVATPTEQLRYPAADTVNLFLRDDKRRDYYLLTVQAGKRADLKQFRRQHGTRQLSFASEQDLMDILGLRPGTVNPIALLRDTRHNVQFFLDRNLLAPLGIVALHPNNGTAILWMKTQDLLDLLEEHGVQANLAEF